MVWYVYQQMEFSQRQLGDSNATENDLSELLYFVSCIVAISIPMEEQIYQS